MKNKFNFNTSQLTLPFGEAVALGYENREKIFWSLSACILCSLFVYFYAVNAIARNTADRSNLEAHLASASGEVAALEFAHISLKNEVTIEKAGQFGFFEVKSPLYVTRDAEHRLTLNSE